MIKLLYLSVALTIEASIRRYGKSYFVGLVNTANMLQFYPPGVKVLRQDSKPELKYGDTGNESNGVRKFIDSTPVENRIVQIESLLGHINREQLFQHTRSNYQKYVVSSMFIQVRVLRLLLRFATNRWEGFAQPLASATDIIAFLQNSFPDEDFSYLTPDYILDWYNMLGDSLLVFAHEEYSDPTHLTDDAIVQIKPGRWKTSIVSPRLERLKLTGYEFYH